MLKLEQANPKLNIDMSTNAKFLILTICVFLNACIVYSNYTDHIAGMVERTRGVEPESKWNNKGIWYRAIKLGRGGVRDRCGS